MKYTAFISYEKSAIELAVKIYNDLQFYGTRCFLDVYSIKPGESIPKEIRNALSASDYIICLVTSSWKNSTYCNIEIDSMIMNGKKIIPLLVEKDVSLPTDISYVKAIDFVNWRDSYTLSFTELLKTISYSTNFYDVQTEYLLNSSVLPWLTINSVSFDFIFPELFIDSTIVDNKHRLITSLKQWINSYTYNKNIIIIGEPGSGKSTFVKYITIYGAKEKKILYFTAKELVNEIGDVNFYSVDNIISQLYPYGYVGLDIDDVKNIVIDGVDEIGAEHLDKLFSICKEFNRKGIKIILAARSEFYYRFIHTNPIRNAYFHSVLEIKAWTVSQGLDFVFQYSEKVQLPIIHNRISELVHKNDYILPLLQNPFKTSLLLFLYSDEKYMPEKDLSNIYVLYDEFYYHYLSQEISKGTSKLPYKYISLLHERIAQKLIETHSFVSLHEILIDEPYDEESFVNDSGFAGILKINNRLENVIEKFKHETLSEYLCARKLVNAFLAGNEHILDNMEIIYTNNVNIFVRAFFATLPEQKLLLINSHLSDVYKKLLQEEYSISLIKNERIREQLIYYTGRVPSKTVPDMLYYAYSNEVSSILKRSAALSLILAGDDAVEKEYLTKIKNDEVYNIENRSIQLVYFGDVDSDLHTFRDDGRVDWTQTKKTLLARFQQNTYRDHRLRLWDLITFRSFIESRGNEGISTDDISIIQQCKIEYYKNSTSRLKMLQVEKSELLSLLET